MSFSASVGQWGSKTKGKVDQTRRATCLKLFSAVILDTPVLSGRLRGNWLCGVDVLKLFTTETEDKSGQLTMMTVENELQKLKGDQTAYLSNNLPYAARVEFDGWSSVKAPEGMMRKNVARFNELLRAEAAK